MWEIFDSYISGIIAALEILFFTRWVLDKKLDSSKVYFVLTVIITATVYCSIYLFLDGVIKTIAVIVVNMFLCCHLYKVTFAKAIFMNFVFIILLLFPDLLVLFCLTNIFGMSKEFCYNVFAGSYLGTFTIFIIFMGIIYLLRNPLKKLFETKIDANKKIILYSILTFICVALFFYTLIDKFLFSNDIFMYLLCILVLLLVLSNLIKQVIENGKLTDKYDKLLEFMTTYEDEIENQRILRHEVQNEFLVIKAKLLDSEKNDEIVDYVDEILKDKIVVKYEKYARFGHLPTGIKGLCYYKIQEAENKDITAGINVSDKVKEFNYKKLTLSEQRNLARILGVLLDNSREASLLSTDKKLGIELYSVNEDKLKIIVSNSFINEVDLNKIGKERVSTKGENRGHGLLLVNRLLHKNPIFNLKTEVTSNVYSQILTIDLKNK